MNQPTADRVSIERLPPTAWAVAAVLGLSVIYLVLQVAFVRPYLWPAGHGARLAGDSRFGGGSDERPLLARPPAIDDHPVGGTIVRDVRSGTPAAAAGLREGDTIVRQRNLRTGAEADLSELMMAEAPAQLRVWRDSYRMALDGDLRATVERDVRGEPVSIELTLERHPAWRSSADIRHDWARRHFGMTMQIVVFVGAALVLFLLRTTDVTAAFSVLALALSGIGGGGPLMGSERVLPGPLAATMTVFAWIAGPFAFPSIALALLYFPAKSPLVVRWPWLHAVPFLAAAPMIAMGLMTGLYLAGVDAALPWAVRGAEQPTLYSASFAIALAVNVLAVGEGVLRYRRRSAPEQRRVRIALYCVIPGVLAYVLKDGVPMTALLAGLPAPEPPWWLVAFLQALVLLPAFGVTYAVAVHRVLGPRVVLRRSLQYALARRTLGIAAAIPFTALTVSLVQARNRTLTEIVRGAPLFYVTLMALCLAALKYRDRAHGWLDQRFFRDEYDARRILLSLASRVRFETDPNDLSAMVVNQIDEALHPRLVAILASGIEQGAITPIASLPAGIEPLPLEGGLASMLRWSDEPLEIVLDDPRSPARRLPPDEQAWLRRHGAALIVPILGQGRALTAVIALGERRSEEPYTAEDRQLLASIAVQVGVGLDVARLRRRMVDSAGGPAGEVTTKLLEAAAPMLECPQCGRCEEGDLTLCASDGTPLARVPGIPRVVEHKYRIDQRIGRGGMGAVYRARDVRLDRDVAIKVVRADLLGDPDARRRFRREAQLVARLQHPSIVSIFDYGTLHDGGAYLVMELVRGEDLRRILTREGRLSAARAVRILSNVCGAIDVAHRAGILHRDLKPENVLTAAGESEIKVLDFGVAKLLAAADDERRTDSSPSAMLTVDGVVVGTPAYMAPEQLRGEPLDARSDVFSLGVIAFEMLTGDLPFGRGSLADIVLRQTRGVPTLRSDETRGREIAPALETAVQSALQLDPSMRPVSPSAFAGLVQSALGLS